MDLIDQYQPRVFGCEQFPKEPCLVLLVGCGELGSSLLVPWQKQEQFNFSVISSKAEKLSSQHDRVHFFADLEQLPAEYRPDMLVLAVPPSSLAKVLSSCTRFLTPHSLVISVAASFTLAAIAKKLPVDTPVVRCMPNLAAEIGESVTLACYNSFVNERMQTITKELFSSLGSYFVLEKESHMDVVTPLIASGPAYLFLLAEALEASGRALGLEEESLHTLVCNMLKGSTNYLCHYSKDKKPSQLREAVTSKAGITATVMEVLRPNFEKLIYQGVHRGQQRCRELNNENNR